MLGRLLMRALGPRAGTLDERGRPGRSAKEFAWSAKDFERYHQRLEPFLKSAAADISHVAQDAFADCMYEEYQQQLHNSREEKVMVDLRTKARKKYKELNEMNAARSLAPLPAILQNMLNSVH